MKSKVLTYGLISVIFLVLCAVTFFLVQPIYRSVSGKITALRDYALALTDTYFGVQVKYESMSPSILSNISLKNVHIIDSIHTTEIITLKKIVVQYNLFKLLQGDMENALLRVTLDTGLIGYNEQNHIEVVEKIMTFIDSQNTQKVQSGESKKISLFDVPITVTLKNIRVSYANNDIAAQINLKKASLTLSNADIVLDIRGSFNGETDILQQNTYISGNFMIDGTVNKSLTASNARVTFSRIESNSFSLSRMSFLFSLSNSVINMNMIQNLLPIQLAVQFHLKTNELQVRLDAEKFSPLSLITIKDQNGLIKKMKDSHISGTYTFSLNTNTFAIHYSANGSVFISKNLLPSTGTVRFNVIGDAENIHIKKAQIISEQMDISAEGSFNFKKRTPEGYIHIEKFEMPNGGIIQADMYLEPNVKGFTCFIPHLILDEQELTAIQIGIIVNDTSVDFDFELYDYSHFETDMPSKISAEGSIVWGDALFAQMHISLDTLYLDSITQIILFFLDETGKKNIQPIVSAVSPYALSNELYFSTDLKSFSFNAPRIIVVNTQKEREFAVFSVTGNNNAVDITQIDILSGTHSLQGSAHVAMENNFNDIFFTTEFIFNALPYRFQGSYVAGSYINISGDYALDVFINIRDPSSINGSVFFTQLPLPLNPYILSLSSNANFFYRSGSEWNAVIAQFEVEDVSNTFFFKPKIALSGRADNFGVFFDTIAYTDTTSLLSGSGGISWQYDSFIFNSLNMNINMENPLSSENHSISFTVSNPEMLIIGTPDLLHHMYISANAEIQQFPFSRVMQGQKKESIISGSISALGTIDSLYISANVSSASIMLQTIPLSFSGQISLEDNEISILNTTVQYQNHYVRDIEGVFSLTNFTGTIHALLAANIADTIITSPIRLSIDVPETNLSAIDLQTLFTVELEIQALQGNNFGPLEPLTMQLVRTPGRMDFSGGPNQSIEGYFLDTGAIAVQIRDPIPATLTLEGTIIDTDLNVQVSDIRIDLQKFEKLLTFPAFGLHQGIVTGNASITGLVTDPTFGGSLLGKGLIITSPDFTSERIGPFDAPIIAHENIIEILPQAVQTQKGSVLVSVSAIFDRWAFDLLNLKLKSINGTFIAGNYKMDMLHATGDTTIDLDIQIKLDAVTVTGEIYVAKGNVIMTLPDSKEEISMKKEKNTMDVFVDMTINIGEHVEGSFQVLNMPLVRGLITAETPITVMYDSVKDEFSVRGKLGLRGGEIYYVKRSFYIREGQVDLNINEQNIDPIITIRAEIREQDADGKPVRIILTAENQPVSMLSPRLTAEPAKSEAEIAVILGQSLSGGVAGAEKQFTEFLISASDILTQMGIFRNIETKIREFFNFDIFSLRTMFIQNAIMGANTVNSQGKPLSLGNFLDNSTVYIGKYIGTSLYMDSLFHFVYDDTEKLSPFFGGLLIQPELGFEMTTPFFNIRWSLAPENLNSLFVSNNSITISWRFSL